MNISTNTSTTGHVRIGSSSSIDFAFWILLQDGLHISSFDKHTGGNQILQSHGMNATSWLNWLKLILIHHDNRLDWHIPDINQAVKDSIQSFQQVLDINHQINGTHNQDFHNTQHQFYWQQLTEQEQSYQEALTDYEGLDLKLIKNYLPPQLWQYGQEIRGLLTQLWDEYQLVKYSNQFISNILQKSQSWVVETNPPINKYREIYLVDYPHEVEMFVHPIFAIVSLPNYPFDEAILEQRLFRIIDFSDHDFQPA
jgi:hypothetical protein